MGCCCFGGLRKKIRAYFIQKQARIEYRVARWEDSRCRRQFCRRERAYVRSIARIDLELRGQATFSHDTSKLGILSSPSLSPDTSRRGTQSPPDARRNFKLSLDSSNKSHVSNSKVYSELVVPLSPSNLKPHGSKLGLESSGKFNGSESSLDSSLNFHGSDSNLESVRKLSVNNNNVNKDNQNKLSQQAPRMVRFLETILGRNNNSEIDKVIDVPEKEMKMLVVQSKLNATEGKLYTRMVSEVNEDEVNEENKEDNALTSSDVLYCDQEEICVS